MEREKVGERETKRRRETETEREVEEEREGGRFSQTTRARRHLLIIHQDEPLNFLNVFSGYRPIHFCI